jgi:glucose/mannose-6-phosphate isomerase
MTVRARQALFDLAAAVPEQMIRAAEATRGQGTLPRPEDIGTIAVLGMGVGAAAGQAIQALCGPKLSVPVLAVHSYALSPAIGRNALVFAVSGSGNTDEVNHAAAEAVARGAHLVAVTSGGWLDDLARSCRAPVLRIESAIQPARAAFGVIVALLLSALEESGLASGARGWIADAASHLGRCRTELERPDGLAGQLASKLRARHVTVQGDEGLGAVAAQRWKAQINQNAHQPASISEQPNASHGEALAWDYCPCGPSTTETVVLLRHTFEHPRVARNIDRLAQYLDGKLPVDTVCATGDGPLAALMELVMIGDFVSLHLAEINKVDPMATAFVSDTLKEGMLPPELPRRPGV